MVKGFFTKKLKGQETFSEKLKNTRESKGISIADAEIGAKIKAKYLKALEENDWSVLPPNVYTRGFVLAYAKYLEIDQQEILNLFEAEISFLSRHRKRSGNFSYENSLKDYKLLITPKLIGYTALGIFILSMFGYIFLQFMSFAGNPNLELSYPNNNVVVEDDVVDIGGLTDIDIFLTVNNEKIPVTSDGHFSTNLKLHRGVNLIKVTATNKMKKETTRVVTIEYKPKTAMNFEEIPQN